MTQSFDIKIGDLPPDFREIAEAIGLDAAIALARARGGEQVYVPKLATLERPAKEREIVQTFNGRNHRQLARLHDFSEVHIRTIVKRRVSGPPPADDQLPLFGH